MKTLSVRVGVAALCALAAGAVAVAVDEAPPPRPVRIEEDPRDTGKEYQALFEKVGRAGLPDLTKGRDTGLALHAAWELHKKLVPRPREPGAEPLYLAHTYDAAEMKKFLAFLKDRTKAPVPDWWAEGISTIGVRKGELHRHLGEDPKKVLTKIEVGDRAWYVREGVKLSLRDDVYTYKSGGVSIEVPKPMGRDGFFRGNCLADIGAGRVTCLATYWSSVGFQFPVVGFESKSGKRLWESEVWADALGFYPSSGPGGRHRVELATKGDTVFVFGGYHGLYLEAFDLETGKCRFRFSTSYWCNYSEKWKLNTGG